MSTQQKLTKKQKKALAFRARKGKSKASLEEDILDVPVSENQDLDGGDSIEMEVEKDAVGTKTQAPEENKGKKSGGGSRKRKREEAESLEGNIERDIRPKKKKGDDVSAKPTSEGDDPNISVKTKTPQRYILFVGNLKYATSKESILKHFSACDPPPAVRLPVPKTTRPLANSKGYAFLEFTEKKGLQAALRLHHSELEGRKINVELTAGGGGKSEHRLNKVKERNKALLEQRKRRITKNKSSGAPGDDDQMKELERPQRYSSTSGFSQAPTNKKTWSVPDSNQQSQRSSESKNRKRPRKAKDQGTGVNAIPVY